MKVTISQSGNDTVLDKTYNDISDAYNNLRLVMAIEQGESYTRIMFASTFGVFENKYGVQIGSYMFASSDPDGVLTLEGGN